MEISIVYGSKSLQRRRGKKKQRSRLFLCEIVTCHRSYGPISRKRGENNDKDASGPHLFHSARTDSHDALSCATRLVTTGGLLEVFGSLLSAESVTFSGLELGAMLTAQKLFTRDVPPPTANVPHHGA